MLVIVCLLTIPCSRKSVAFSARQGRLRVPVGRLQRAILRTFLAPEQANGTYTCLEGAHLLRIGADEELLDLAAALLVVTHTRQILQHVLRNTGLSDFLLWLLQHRMLMLQG